MNDLINELLEGSNIYLKPRTVFAKSAEKRHDKTDSAEWHNTYYGHTGHNDGSERADGVFSNREMVGRHVVVSNRRYDTGIDVTLDHHLDKVTKGKKAITKEKKERLLTYIDQAIEDAESITPSRDAQDVGRKVLMGLLTLGMDIGIPMYVRNAKREERKKFATRLRQYRIKVEKLPTKG